MKHAPHLQEFLKVQAASIKRSPTVLDGGCRACAGLPLDVTREENPKRRNE